MQFHDDVVKHVRKHTETEFIIHTYFRTRAILLRKEETFKDVLETETEVFRC